jgi:hypothetical protein
MHATFKQCYVMTGHIFIPGSVTKMLYTFEDCDGLSGKIEIEANPNDYTGCFRYKNGPILYIGGSSLYLEELAATDKYTDMSEHDTVRVASGSMGMVEGDVIPAGATYYIGVGQTKIGDYSTAKEIRSQGNTFPFEVKPGDVFVYGDYEYRYQYYFSNDDVVWKPSGSSPIGGWRARVLDNTKSSYGEILACINGENVTDLTRTFYQCKNLTVSPGIPESVYRMDETYYGCTALTVPPMLPQNTFYINGTFRDCTAMAGLVEIGSKVSVYDNCFKGTSKRIYISGTATSSIIQAVARTDGYSDGSSRDNVIPLAPGQTVTTYVVNHWQQNLKGVADKHDIENYTRTDVDRLASVSSISVSPELRSYAGFKAPAKVTVTIAADGSTVVDYYYTRNVYYIDINMRWDGTDYNSIGVADSPTLFDVVVNGEVTARNVADYWRQHPYGSTYELIIKPKTGYICRGVVNGSAPLAGTVGVNGASVRYIIETLVNTGYTVNYWQQKIGTDGSIHVPENYTKVDSERMVCFVGDEVSPVPKTYVGFVTPTAVKITPKNDGSTVIDYYYERQTYYLDLNLYLDGVRKTSSEQNTCCLFTITVNGVVVAKDVKDYYQQLPYGSTYSIEMKVLDGYSWDGSMYGVGRMSGTITGTTAVEPKIYTIP